MRRIRKLLCRLFGCTPATDDDPWSEPHCGRCDARWRGPGFIDRGLWQRFYRRITGRRCLYCGRRYWSTTHGQLCSQKCEDNETPF